MQSGLPKSSLKSGPTSQEVGGLKFIPEIVEDSVLTSHLAGGGWIEIYDGLLYYGEMQSHLAGGGWIEIIICCVVVTPILSHLAGGGWIEMALQKALINPMQVPPRRRWVD